MIEGVLSTKTLFYLTGLIPPQGIAFPGPSRAPFQVDLLDREGAR